MLAFRLGNGCAALIGILVLSASAQIAAAGSFKAYAANCATSPDTPANSQTLTAAFDGAAPVTVVVPPGGFDPCLSTAQFTISYNKLPAVVTATWTDSITKAVVSCSATISSPGGRLNFILYGSKCSITKK